jgi:hypothetical protein
MLKTLLLAASMLVMTLPRAILAASDTDLIRNAETAGPADVASNSNVYGFGENGNMRLLRRGASTYWCMPDDPSTPDDDPMCGDTVSMEWVMAWMGGKARAKDKVGLIYTLAGGSDASNTDPFGTAPSNANNWIKTGRHIMITGATDLMRGYPAESKPDVHKPNVMWAGTPYAHLMVPLD